MGLRGFVTLQVRAARVCMTLCARTRPRGTSFPGMRGERGGSWVVDVHGRAHTRLAGLAADSEPRWISATTGAAEPEARPARRPSHAADSGLPAGGRAQAPPRGRCQSSGRYAQMLEPGARPAPGRPGKRTTSPPSCVQL